MDDGQRASLASFIARYTARTDRSRQLAAQERMHHADPRSAAHFDIAWKDLVYPIASDRSNGSRIWDVDGNEYIDIAMGFGVHMFGHQPPFVVKAIREQLELGYQLGPQSHLAASVAERICSLTEMERVVFCNSGSEAVMTALRLARAVTGRDTVALFTDSYHGTFDGVLARSRLGSSGEALSGAPGTPRGMVADLLVLEYGNEESLEILRRRGPELAAILVEPVQSRRPELQPIEFLVSLREIADEGGAALIFDEIISGFRVHPRGAQGWFDVRADIATYGKMLAGGLPIGVVAGAASYLDAIDGGRWEYGDDSVPSAPQTFFAGTFAKHPLTLAATLAVLSHLEDAGPSLQDDLNARTSAMREALNLYFEREQLPLSAAGFGSQFIFRFASRARFSDLFSYRLIEKGVYVWEGRTCYLSTAHTDDDVARVSAAVRESADELASEGFLPRQSEPGPTAVG